MKAEARHSRLFTYEQFAELPKHTAAKARGNNSPRLAADHLEHSLLFDKDRQRILAKTPFNSKQTQYRLRRQQKRLSLIAALALFAAQGHAQLLPDLATVRDEGFGADAQLGETLAIGDFDGDGRDDLAMGSPGINEIRILFGALSGGTAVDQLFESDAGSFGAALAVCDINRDGKDDLVVGAPATTVGTASSAGKIYFYLGSSNPSQLIAAGTQTDDIDEPGHLETPETGDHFGAALAVGDLTGFNRDCDLAVGVPGQEVNDKDNAGAVRIFRVFPGKIGTNTLFASLHEVVDVATAGVAEANSEFGLAIATQTIGFTDDLVVSAPFRDNDGINAAGDVTVFHNDNGIHPSNAATIITETMLGFTNLNSNSFGKVLATGDFDGNERDELVIGAPFGAVSANQPASAGLVYILSAETGSLSLSERWHQGRIAGTPEELDQFGGALQVGNFNADNYEDLAIGSPFEDFGRGRVDVVYGNHRGLDGTTQSFVETDVGGTGAIGAFGAAFAAGDLDHDGADDLAIGMPLRDDGGSMPNEGLVYLVPSQSHLRSAEILIQEGSSIVTTSGVLTPTSFAPPSFDLANRLHVSIGLVGLKFAVLRERPNQPWEMFFHSVDELETDLLGAATELAIESPNRFAFRTSFTESRSPSGLPGSDLIYDQDGPLAFATDPLPGVSGALLDFLSSPRVTATRTYFKSSSLDNSSHLLRSTLAGDHYELAINHDTWMEGQALRRISSYDINPGSSLLAVSGRLDDADDTFIAGVNGVVVAMEDEEVVEFRTAAGGQHRGSLFYRTLDLVSVDNDSWLLGGTVDDGSENDYFLGVLLASDNSELFEGTFRETGFLRTLRPRAVSRRFGYTLSRWDRNGGDSTLVLSCGPNLTNHSIVLRQGDLLDFNGDDLGDAEVIDSVRAESPPSAGPVVVTTRIDLGAERRDVVLRLTGTGCAMFADGFENGDISAWTATGN